MLICVTVLILKHDLFNYFHIGNVNTRRQFYSQMIPHYMHRSSDDVVHLYANVNYDLRSFTDWFKANKLSLNTSKTNYMLFCLEKIDQNEHSIKIGVDVIQRTNSCKFLGIMIDDKFTWSEHIVYTKSKLCRSLYAISRSNNFVPLKHLKTLYDSLIHPYFSYGIVLWGSTYSSYLQKIRICQKKAIRHIYRSAYNAHIALQRG